MGALNEQLSLYRNLSALLDAAVERFDDRVAISLAAQEMRYAEFRVRADRFGAWLMRTAGLLAGNRVAVMLPNTLDYLPVLLGIWKAGGVGVLINPLFTARELELQLLDSEATILIALPEGLQMAKQGRASHALRCCVSVGRAGEAGDSFLSDILSKAATRPVEWPKVSTVDLALLQYTGGTTGVSKGAMLSHGNVIADVLQTEHVLAEALRPDAPVVLTALPLYHIFALVVNALVVLHVGGRNVLVANPKAPAEMIDAFARHRISVVTGVNTLFVGLIALAAKTGLSLSGVKLALGGGSAIQAAVSEAWKVHTGSHILEGYGLSETAAVVSVNRPDTTKFNGTVGQALPLTQVRVVDEAGVSKPVCQVGEICVAGPQVMRGYWRRPEESGTVFTTDGFFRTGDIGFVDESGRITICDRKKDMVLVSGFNVYPNEVEAVLASHPGVLESAVIGLPDIATGEAVHAWIVLRDPDAIPSEAELIAHCRTQLAAYKVPRHFHFTLQLPKSTVGKVLRRALRQSAVSLDQRARSDTLLEES